MGCISYANHGPDSNGSVFQITLSAAGFLDGKSVVFGAVVDSMSLETLCRLNNYGQSWGEPTKEVRIVGCGAAFAV